MTITRPNWAEYFLQIAETVSLRADCRRRQHGAVVVKNNQIVATGYNGAAAGTPGCLEGACPRGLLGYDVVKEFTNYDAGAGRCISTHAEINALLRAGFDRTNGATIYITGEPCPTCWKTILAAGVAKAVWKHPTTGHHVTQYAEQGLFTP